MLRVKVWIDVNGIALEFPDNRVELSEAGLSDLIEELGKLQGVTVSQGDTLATEFCIELEDE